MDDELIEQRFELVDDRFEHFERRLTDLEDARADRHGRRMNWAMLGLFVVEVVIGVIEIWMMRHG